MENILLIFLNNLERTDEFNRIIDEFDKNGYKMYLLDNIKEDQFFSFDELPNLVDFYKKGYKNVNKTVVLSNSRDLIFFWYRCYNSVADDFIYFIDANDKDYFTPQDRHFNFYYNLYEFNGIDRETVEGKIYLNINFNNYNQIINFLLKNNNFRFFSSLENFYFQELKTNKNQLSKKYIFNDYEYSFEINNSQNYEKLHIEKNLQNGFLINESFLKDIVDNYYIIPYLTVIFYKKREQVFTNFLLSLFGKLKETDRKVQKKIFEELFIYINEGGVDFKEKIYISSLLVMINGGDERLAEFIMKTLLKDKEYMEYHYEVIANVMFYCSNENLVKHNNFYLDLRNEIEKMADWISKDKKLKILDSQTKKLNNKKIAFVVDQLVSLHHSPTKLMLDYAKNIKKYCPNYKIKIFVEDNLYCKNEMGIISHLYTSAVSNSIKDEHYKYLNDKSIGVYYVNVNLSKKSRIINLANKIIEFSPDVILTNSDISVVNRIFYNKYPIVFMSMGGNYFNNLADAYLCGMRERVVESNKKYRLLDERKIYEFKYGLEFAEPKKIVSRNDYNIGQNDFVMVTVGNRLDAEMNEEFIDNMIKFIMKNENVRWLIVGGGNIQYIKDKYDYLLNDKIIKIQYENDLQALYRICDVYANPRRKGGGISIAMAMNEGLPIAVFKDKSDGAAFVEYDNCSGVNIQEYINDLEMLRLNEKYRKYKGKLMCNRIISFTFRKSIENLLNVITKIMK